MEAYHHLLVYNTSNQGWGQVQYLYLSTYLLVLDVLGVWKCPSTCT